MGTFELILGYFGGFDINFGWKLLKTLFLVSLVYWVPILLWKFWIWDFQSRPTKNGHFIAYFRLFLEDWLITSNFDICFGLKIPKTFSLGPFSVIMYPYSCESSEYGIFYPRPPYNGYFIVKGYLEGLCLTTSILTLCHFVIICG